MNENKKLHPNLLNQEVESSNELSYLMKVYLDVIDEERRDLTNQTLNEIIKVFMESRLSLYEINMVLSLAKSLLKKLPLNGYESIFIKYPNVIELMGKANDKEKIETVAVEIERILFNRNLSAMEIERVLSWCNKTEEKPLMR